MNNRIKKIFINKSNKLASFVTGGYPNLEISLEIIHELVRSGSDIIEIGIPFSDPMADGPIIQQSNLRAIKKGINLESIFLICKNFRASNNFTPIILMGYYNPIHYYGNQKFIEKCKESGVDGLMIVDLQPEFDDNLINLAKKNNIEFIRFITPTTDNNRLDGILPNAGGFLYYISITGITGQKSPDLTILKSSINYLRDKTNLPILVGFGVNTSEQAKKISEFADGVIIGSSIVKIIQQYESKKGIPPKNDILKNINKFVSSISAAIK